MREERRWERLGGGERRGEKRKGDKMREDEKVKRRGGSRKEK